MRGGHRPLADDASRWAVFLDAMLCWQVNSVAWHPSDEHTIASVRHHQPRPQAFDLYRLFDCCVLANWPDLSTEKSLCRSVFALV